jgi:hypothetical protein
MELIYSKEWHEKNEDRKDFTYTPKVKQQIDAMCWHDKTPEEKELADKILSNYQYEE